MDRERFDTLTRIFASPDTRRAVVGALLTAGLSISVPRALSRDKRHRRKSKGLRKRRAKGGSPVVTQAVDCSSLGHGVNASGCDYTGEDHWGEDLSSSAMVGTIFRDGTLTGANFSSSNLRNAIFRGAAMCGADLRSSNVRGANFRDADLTLVSFKSSGGCNTATFTDGTTFCGTTMCTGTVRNDDCPGGPPAGFCCTDVNCGPGQVCQENACCATDLGAAVAAASSGATIHVCAGNFLTRGVQIAIALTIVGAGAETTVLDAQDVGRVFQIGPGAVVELRDLTITGGNVFGSLDGGGVFNQGSLTMLRVTVRNNRASGAGGGIGSDTGSILVLGNGTRVENNRAAGNGGGINNGGMLTLQSGSRVENNLADAGGLGFGEGGGIFNGPAGTVVLDPGSVVTGNTPDNCEPTIGSCT